jgi:hypothetical protein
MVKRKEITLADKISQIVNGIVFDDDFELNIVDNNTKDFLQEQYNITKEQVEKVVELVLEIKKVVEQ